MLRSTVLKQRDEKDRLLSLPYIERNGKAEARKWLDTDLIKVVLGPRRAGKSIFCLKLLNDRPFAYFNFDDDSLPGDDAMDLDELMAELRLAYGDTKNVLFDEIQNVPRWELFVSRLHRQGYNLVLTGSNARLLSKELATALTGRHFPIQMLPFDFAEFLRAKGYAPAKDRTLLPNDRAALHGLLRDFMTNGGYPEVVTKGVEPRGYLDVLFDSVLFKDVIRRHKVRFSGNIDNLGSYLVSNAACPYTIRKLANVLQFRSAVTLEKYLGYLTEAYLVFSLQRYSAKAGLRIRSPKKSYVVDNGFITAKAFQHSPNDGKLMENLVFTELVKRGNEPNRELFAYRTRNDLEVDFMRRKGHTVVELIQVSYDVADPDVLKREVRALVEAGKELGVGNLTLLTWNEKREMETNGMTIRMVPLWEWLLDGAPNERS
jgi:predicted AAA+ superfamily ATPase